MRKAIAVVAALATTLALAVAGTAAAGQGGHKALFRYFGQVNSTNGSSVTVTVQNGNRAALRSLLGQSQQQTFSTDGSTVFLSWDKGKPTKVDIGALASGDYVRINIRADRGSSLDTIRSTAAGLIGDHGPTLHKPALPLYLYRGTLVSTSDGSVTINVKGGNRAALKTMIGSQGSQQTFATNGDTIFLQWSQRIPTVTDASGLHVGDPIIVRVRAARGSDLATVEQTAARRVAGHEPRQQEQAQDAQS